MTNKKGEPLQGLPVLHLSQPESVDEPEVGPQDGSMAYTDRVLIAMKLARDVNTCADLLKGRVVDASRLNPDELASAKRMAFVRLDFDVIDKWFGDGARSINRGAAVSDWDSRVAA